MKTKRLNEGDYILTVSGVDYALEKDSERLHGVWTTVWTIYTLEKTGKHGKKVVWALTKKKALEKFSKQLATLA